MKQLFSLALKYIRRQKLRSTLMFLCITLSVFILDLFMVCIGSTLRSVRNEAIQSNGEWEVKLSGAFEECNNGGSSRYKSADEAALAVMSDVNVDKMYYSSSYSYRTEYNIDSDGMISFFDIKLDNGKVFHSHSIEQSKHLGDTSIIGEYDESDTPISSQVRSKLSAPDAAVLPGWIHEAGYDVGDRITITITPAVYSAADEDSVMMNELRKVLNERNASDDRSYYVIEDEADGIEVPDGKRLVKAKAFAFMSKFLDISSLEMEPVISGKPVELTLTIGGFYNSGRYITRNKSLRIDMTGFSTDRALDISRLNDDELVPKERQSIEAAFVLNQNYDFNESLYSLLDDMGFNGEDAYYLLKTSGGLELNSTILAANLRSTDAIASMVPAICLFLILLLILWFFSRFVIDNAFEISVQERSRQFASLRVMGASKRQIAVIVLAEGIFYCLTAVPLGVILSVAAGKSIFTSLRLSGFPSIEFYVYPPAMFISIFLCLLAVFISAYTSAMWASRKLSPAAVMNYGSPTSVKKLRRMAKRRSKKRSELRLGGRRFIVRYTLKNIFRTKKRFLISSVAMTVGVLLFTYCLQLGMYLLKDIKPLSADITQGWDYMVEDIGNEGRAKAESLFADNENFSRYELSFFGEYRFSDIKEADKLESLAPGLFYNSYNPVIDISTVGRYAFERKEMFRDNKDINVSYSDVMGMDYDDFTRCGAILVIPLCGTGEEMETDSDGEPKQKYMPDYYSTYELGISGGIDIQPEGLVRPVKITGVMHYGEWPYLIVSEERYGEYVSEFTDGSLDMYLNVSDTKHYEAAREQIDGFLRDISYSFFCNMYMGNTGLKQFIGTIIKIVLILMLSIWLAGIFSMMHSINTSVLNRSRELLMMRSIGMSRRQLLGTVVLESLLFSAFSIVLGLILGKAAFVLTIYVLKRKIVIWLGTGMMIVSAAVSLLIAILASVPGVRSLGKSIKQNIM